MFGTLATCGCSRVVGVGSCAEYDWSYSTLSEAKPPLNPATHYGRCKNSLRESLDGLAGRTGLSAAWGRIFFPYGPGENRSRLVPSVIQSLLAGSRASCTHGRQIRDFIYVKDAANALAAVLESNIQGPVNIGTGVPRALREFIVALASQMGAEDRVDFGAIPPPAGEPDRLVADSFRLVHDVGWKEWTDLHTAFEQTISWWKDQR